jgi:hypothetical protein
MGIDAAPGWGKGTDNCATGISVGTISLGLAPGGFRRAAMCTMDMYMQLNLPWSNGWIGRYEPPHHPLLEAAVHR